MTLRVITDAPGPGARNMETDLAMASSLGRGEIPPTLRLYGWDPPAISLGYHQSGEEFDAEKIRDAGIDLVRRPTGGRAILHWHELTYSIVLPLSWGAPRVLYERINRALAGGIRTLGIPAEAEGSDKGLRDAYRSPGGVACFARSVRSEIQVGGKKIAGSAQRKLGGVILQHGSFLLGPQHRRLAEFIRGGSGGATRDGLESGTTEAETVLDHPVSFEEAAAAVVPAFMAGFSSAGVPQEAEIRSEVYSRVSTQGAS